MKFISSSESTDLETLTDLLETLTFTLGSRVRAGAFASGKMGDGAGIPWSPAMGTPPPVDVPPRGLFDESPKPKSPPGKGGTPGKGPPGKGKGGFSPPGTATSPDLLVSAVPGGFQVAHGIAAVNGKYVVRPLDWDLWPRECEQYAKEGDEQLVLIRWAGVRWLLADVGPSPLLRGIQRPRRNRARPRAQRP